MIWLFKLHRTGSWAEGNEAEMCRRKHMTSWLNTAALALLERSASHLQRYKCIIVDEPNNYIRFAKLKQHSNHRPWIVCCLKKYLVIPAPDPYINIHIPWCSLPCSLSGFHPLVRTEWAAHPPPAACTGPQTVSEVPGHPVPSCHTAAFYYNKVTSLTQQCQLKIFTFHSIFLKITAQLHDKY